MASSTGERIRALRLLMGLDQTQLGELAGLVQGTVSKFENGLRDATDEHLAKIAAATGAPLSFFTVDPGDLPTDTLRFRKKAAARQRDVHRMESSAREAYRVAAVLIEEFVTRRTTLPAATGDINGDRIEQLATETRHALGVAGDSPLRHVTRTLERAGVAVAPLVLLDPAGCAKENSVGHAGVSCWRGSDDPYLVGYFTVGPGDWQRFTLAHELGHLVLHTRRPNTPTAQAEKEAHRFAGAFLLPRQRAEEILEDFTLRDLTRVKAQWGISIQALIMRASHLDLIDEARRTSLFRQVSARGWKRAEPVTVHHEEPALLAAMMARKFGSPVPLRRASEALGLPVILTRSLAPTSTDALDTVADVVAIRRRWGGQ